MDRKIRYFVNGWSFRLSFATRPGYDGDHEDISDGDSYELGEYENSEEALAAAEAFISTHGNEVNDEEDGIGSVIYWTVEVERRVEYKENEWLPCDESGRIDDGYGNEPNATVAYLSSLEGSREEAGVRACEERVSGMAGTQGRPLYDGLRLHGLGDRYERICFDTETTGLHPNGSDPDEILTISIIGRDGSVLLDERFRPTVKTEWPHASAVNGIYPEDVADLPTIETAIPRLREIFAGADEVIGYNVGFDLGFLSAVGVRPREDARITDTMKEFTWFMGRRYKLVDAADHIGYEWTGRAHGSLADALATLAVQRWLEQWLVAE